MYISIATELVDHTLTSTLLHLTVSEFPSTFLCVEA